MPSSLILKKSDQLVCFTKGTVEGAMPVNPFTAEIYATCTAIARANSCGTGSLDRGSLTRLISQLRICDLLKTRALIREGQSVAVRERKG